MEKISAACAEDWSIELEKGLRSRKPGHPIESINLIGPRLTQWSRELELTRAVYDIYGLVPGEDRLFADAILLRLADTFVSGDKGMKISVLRVFISIYKQCKSKDKQAYGILSNMSKENRLEFLKRVKVVLTDDNVEYKALGLFLFGCCAEIVKEIAEIRLAILSTLFSCRVLEVKAALFAAGCFSEISEDFGSVFLWSLLNLINSTETLPALRIVGARTFSKMRGSFLLATKSYKAGADLVGKPLEEDILGTMLISLTILSSQSFILTSDQIVLLGSFLAQKTSSQLQGTVLRCMRNIGEKAACLLPISAFPCQNLFRMLDEPNTPSLHYEVLHILRKILAYGWNDMLFMDSAEFMQLLRHVDDSTRSPTLSIRLLAFQILVDILNKLKGKDGLIFKVNSVTSPTSVVSAINNQLTLLVNMVLGGTPSSEVEQELGSMFKLLLLLVKNYSELGYCILDKLQSVIKNIVNSENMTSAAIQNSGVHKIVNAGAKQNRPMHVLMFYIYRFLVALHDSLDESGAISNEIICSLKEVVYFVCENSIFDCSVHTYFSLLHSLVYRTHLTNKNQGLSKSPGVLLEHEALVNGCAKNMLEGGDNWFAYKAGKYAACEGEWYVASYFFQNLGARVRSDVCSQWLKFLFQFTDSEKNVKVVLQQASCSLPLDHIMEPSTVYSSVTGPISSEYIKKLENAFDGISASDKVLEALSLQKQTFCFQRWLVALRLKVLFVLMDILKLLNGSPVSKAELESSRHTGGSDHANLKSVFQNMKDTSFSLFELSVKLASVAEECDLISSSFVDLDSKSLKVISALAFSCSILSCCAEYTRLIVDSLVSGSLTRESGYHDYHHSVIVKNLAVRLWHVDPETCTDLMSFSEENGMHQSSLNLLPGFQISKVGCVPEDILTLCRISVKRLIGLRNELTSVKNEDMVRQAYKDSLQLLLNIVEAWMHIPVQIPKYFFRVRPTAGSLLILQSPGSRKQKEILVARGSHLALNLCIQLKNMTSDVCSRFSKIHCIFHCKTSSLEKKGKQKPYEEGWKDYQASETGTMIELNKKLQCHIMKQTREFMNCEGPQSDCNMAETYACFRTNGGVQGFSTCLLDVSAFPVGSYKIHWHSGGVDNEGSYWSFLPLSSCPQFCVTESSERL